MTIDAGELRLCFTFFIGLRPICAYYYREGGRFCLHGVNVCVMVNNSLSYFTLLMKGGLLKKPSSSRPA